MKASQLIEILQQQVEKNGDQDVIISDSHCNACEVGEVEFLRYAQPTIVINTSA